MTIVSLVGKPSPCNASNWQARAVSDDVAGTACRTPAEGSGGIRIEIPCGRRKIHRSPKFCEPHLLQIARSASPTFSISIICSGFYERRIKMKSKEMHFAMRAQKLLRLLSGGFNINLPIFRTLRRILDFCTTSSSSA